MCKPVADKTETAVAYLAARFWFAGSKISHIALHEVLPGNPGFYRHRQLWRVQFVARVADQNRLAQKQDKKIGACPLLGFSQRFLVDLASASPRTLASGPSTAAAVAERTGSDELAAALVSIRAM
jgi:hypothetical protein